MGNQNYFMSYILWALCMFGFAAAHAQEGSEITASPPAFKKETKSLVTEDKKHIVYDHFKTGAKRVVIIAHGFFNSKNAVLLQDLGKELAHEYDVVIMDFRGHGKSKGLFYWTSKEYIDLIAVLDDIKGDYEKIGIIGFSLGAATSIITASKTDVIDSLICISSPAEFEKIEYHFWDLDVENDILYNLIGEGRAGKGVRPGPFWLKKEKPINLVGKVTCPILYIHGENDWLIKPKHSRLLYEKTQSKKDIALIKKGPHAEYLLRENKNKEETIALIENWFRETL